MKFLIVVHQVAVLFLILLAGVVAAKKGMIDDAGKRTLSAVVVNIGLPGMIVASILGGAEVERAIVLKTIALSLLPYIPAGVIAYIFAKSIKANAQQTGVYSFMMMFPNVGFMGFPMVLSTFGEEGLFYASLAGIPFYILVYSLGVYFMKKGSAVDDGKSLVKTLLTNMPFMAAVVAVLIYLAGIKVPSIVVTTAQYMGDISTPLSMVVIGATLSSMNPGVIFKNTKLWLMTLAQLVLNPAITYLVLRPFIQDTLILGVLTVLAAMPVAANCTMLAVEYRSDDRLASEGVFLSTLVSAATIPLVAGFF